MPERPRICPCKSCRPGDAEVRYAAIAVRDRRIGQFDDVITRPSKWCLPLSTAVYCSHDVVSLTKPPGAPRHFYRRSHPLGAAGATSHPCCFRPDASATELRHFHRHPIGKTRLWYTVALQLLLVRPSAVQTRRHPKRSRRRAARYRSIEGGSEPASQHRCLCRRYPGGRTSLVSDP